MPICFPRLRSIARNIRYALRLVWNAAPAWTLANASLVIVQGVLPLASLYAMKQIIDTVTQGIATPNLTLTLKSLTIWVGLAFGVSVITAVCRSLAELATEAQGQLVADKLTDLIHRKSLVVDLAYYENATTSDELNRAQREAASRPLTMFSTVIQVLQSGISVLGILGLLLAYNWKLTLIVAVIALPGAIIRILYASKMHALLKEQTENERRCGYYHWLLTDAYPAKEMRLFQPGEFFSELYLNLRTILRGQRLAVFRRRVAFDFGAQTLGNIAQFAALGYIALSTVQRTITLGSMVMYYQAFQTGYTNLQTFLRNLAGLYEHSLFLEHIYQFLQVDPAIKAIEPIQPLPEHQTAGVKFSGVSFSYPGTETPVLQNIDLEIAPNQVIALVGENGSGKTTLIKLLCRLYDPSQGTISLDGIDIRHFDLRQWWNRLSIVFQDFIRYRMSVYENIRLGDIRKNARHEEVTDAAINAGIHEKVSRLPDGYHTVLGNVFTGGTELSGGEWQKIGIARAFFRDANIVILDEPSSALDPLAEADLFHRFRAVIKDKSAVLISHRFSTVQMADYIYVLERGRIIERGTHRELLALNGAYAHLYRTQAEHYQDEAAISHLR